MTVSAKAIIHKPGPMSLLVDLGRKDYQFIGYSQSGCADEYAFLWANKLLGNHANDCALEVTLGPIEISFTQHSTIAITGAEIRGELSRGTKKTAVKSWQSYKVNRHDTLTIKPAISGLRIYIAIQGGFQVQHDLGSRSMTPRENIGFNTGQPLTADTEMAYNGKQSTIAHQKLVPDRLIPNYTEALNLHLIPSYQFADFDSQAIETLLNNRYRISPNSNRMGYRLQGNSIGQPYSSLQSEGIALGSVQIPTDGQPIILLKERQTIGGYPKLGCISHVDCFKLSQYRPGLFVRFSLSTVHTEQQRLAQFYRLLK